MEKITATTNPVLIFGEQRGIHIFKSVYLLAKAHGMPHLEWVEDEGIEIAEECVEWLNENAVEGCTIEWYEGGVWAIPLGYQMAEGCSTTPFGDYV